MTTSRTALFRFHSTLSMLFILLIASFAEIAGAESSLDWQMKMLEAVEGKRNVKITLRGHSSGEFSLKANELFHLTQQKTVSKVSDSSIENFFPMKVKEGEVEKLNLLYNRYSRRFFGFFYGMTGDGATSEDLVQNVFMRILKYKHTYKENGDFEVWAF